MIDAVDIHVAAELIVFEQRAVLLHLHSGVLLVEVVGADGVSGINAEIFVLHLAFVVMGDGALLALGAGFSLEGLVSGRGDEGTRAAAHERTAVGHEGTDVLAALLGQGVAVLGGAAAVHIDHLEAGSAVGIEQHAVLVDG